MPFNFFLVDCTSEKGSARASRAVTGAPAGHPTCPANMIPHGGTGSEEPPAGRRRLHAGLPLLPRDRRATKFHRAALFNESYANSVIPGIATGATGSFISQSIFSGTIRS